MRIRHGLRLRSADDFDIVTQDSVPKLWDQISQGTFSRWCMSSIALMVGGIGVMAIMSISVTERTREIWHPESARRAPRGDPVQFLMEAAFLTSLGGVIGIALGSGIGLGRAFRHRLSDLAAVVVVRPRPRLPASVGILRHAPGLQGFSAGPD